MIVIWSSAKMSINKSWITIKNWKSLDYMNGVIKDFVEHASNFIDSSGKVRCPCKKPVNMNFKRIGVLRGHLLRNGFHEFYTKWIFHSQKIHNLINEDETRDILNNFMEPDDRGDGVDEEAVGSKQYFDACLLR